MLHNKVLQRSNTLISAQNIPAQARKMWHMLSKMDRLNQILKKMPESTCLKVDCPSPALVKQIIPIPKIAMNQAKNGSAVP